MHHNHNQWGKVMQGGLEQLRRYAAAAAAAASAPAKRSKFSPKLYTSACSFIHSGHFTRFSVHIKLYTLPPFQRAIQKMVCTHFHSNENLATDKAAASSYAEKKWNDKKRKYWRKSPEEEKPNGGEGRVHLARPPDETEEVEPSFDAWRPAPACAWDEIYTAQWTVYNV